MSIRIKVFLIITAIILVITASSMVISVTAAQSEIISTLENGMQSVASVANEYISGEVEMLFMDASSVAQFLRGIQPQDLHRTLQDLSAAYSDFMAITIFNASGRVEATYGSVPAPEEMALGELGKQAFEGKRSISTSRQDSASGQLVFHIFVPLDDTMRGTTRSRIVALTVPGDFFSKKINQFHLWGSGNISLGDNKGTIIAYINQDLVAKRMSYLDLVSNDKRYSNAVEAIKDMVTGGRGASRYSFDGEDSVTAFMPLTASNQGWFVAVTTLVVESAYSQVRMLILISGFIFLGLGLIAAALASGSVAKPFYQIRAQNKQLTEMGEALQTAQVAKTNFLANMSFDMRTPLNAVIGLSELSLTKKGVPVDVRNYLDRIYNSGQKLMEVVSELLDISNMESGKFGVIPAEYDLSALINDTVSINVVQIGSKPIRFHINADEKLPARLMGDSLRVRQIYNVLLSNAFRYTSVGSVEWRISTERDGDSYWLVSSITDTGVGIKPENIDKLFIDYNRVNNRVQGSSGLGLTLAKKIAGLMDGTITVESVLGKGSTFTVRVRQKSVSADTISTDTVEALRNFNYVEQTRSDKAELQRVQLAGKKVLVVDDMELNLEIAQGMLEPYGLTVSCLLNGREAIESIHHGEIRYDAIFISHWMSEMTGKDAVQIIRKEIDSDYAKTVPIIALTSNIAVGNKDIFLAWGYQDILSKPLDITLLDKIVNKWLGGKAS
jgi:signal transduction histidine kinase